MATLTTAGPPAPASAAKAPPAKDLPSKPVAAVSDKPVAYEVTGVVFVNGSLHEPVNGQRVIVWARPGLAGRALQLIDGAVPPEAQAAGV
jgi:hypothetical protein